MYSDDEDVNSSYDAEDDLEASIGGDQDSPLQAALSNSLEFSFKALEPSDIVTEMDKVIVDVKEVLGLSSTVIRLLLHHFKWDKEKLLETYYTGDQERLFKDACIIHPSQVLPVRQTTNSTRPVECGICAESVSISSLTGLLCNHSFCPDCWRKYLTFKVMDEGIGQTISCPALDCEILVDDSLVMKLLREPKVIARYQYLITNSFVQCNRLLSWCPAPDCQMAVQVQCYDVQPVTCKCGFSFCFGCKNEDHRPIKCSLLKKWFKKVFEDGDTSNWLAINTKQCPKCHATIEKEGGCNHMCCRNQACRHHFCWVCLGSWEPHGSAYYNCNRYNEAEAKKARDQQDKSRESLTRYLHYHNRFMNHKQSLKFDNKLYAETSLKMEELQTNGMSWIEVQFLKKAVDVLCQCRQTLMYTYGFAYYLKSTNESALFETNQADLEHATELLSEYLEREFKKDEFSSMKTRVQDKISYCQTRCQTLMDHVYEGYEQNQWEFLSIA